MEVVISEVLKKLLILEASRWVGTTEVGGNNKGQIVEKFQKTVDSKAQGEAWCMAAVQTWCVWTKNYFDTCHPPLKDTIKLAIYPSEHCLTVWNKTDPRCRIKSPTPGCVIIWRHGQTTNGHTGIFVEMLPNGKMKTIEGNTGDGKGVVRDGDGVYFRERSLTGEGDMKVVGFIDPFLIPKADS
jgi:hypothetical protein